MQTSNCVLWKRKRCCDENTKKSFAENSKSNGKAVIPVFTLNRDDTIRKDPFFYVCDGGLCFDYIKECEEIYRTNVTEAVEIK